MLDVVVFHYEGRVIEKQHPDEYDDIGTGFWILDVVVFHHEEGVIEKQHPDEYNDIGTGFWNL